MMPLHSHSCFSVLIILLADLHRPRGVALDPRALMQAIVGGILPLLMLLPVEMTIAAIWRRLLLLLVVVCAPALHRASFRLICNMCAQSVLVSVLIWMMLMKVHIYVRPYST